MKGDVVRLADGTEAVWVGSTRLYVHGKDSGKSLHFVDIGKEHHVARETSKGLVLNKMGEEVDE